MAWSVRRAGILLTVAFGGRRRGEVRREAPAWQPLSPTRAGVRPA